MLSTTIRSKLLLKRTVSWINSSNKLKVRHRLFAPETWIITTLSRKSIKKLLVKARVRL